VKRGQISALPETFVVDPYRTSALPRECVNNRE